MDRTDPFKFAAVYVVLSVAVFIVADTVSPSYGVFIVVPLLGIFPLLLLIRHHPAVFIPLVFYASSFKAQAATSNFDPSDPTLLALALLAAAVAFHGLLILGGIYRPSLGDRIRGQAREIQAYFLLAAVVSLSYLYTRSPDYGFTELSRFLVIGSLLYLSPIILVRHKNDLRDLITTVVLLSAAVAVRRIIGMAAYSGPSGPDTVEDLTKIGAAELIGMGLLLLLLPPVSARARLPRKLMWLLIPIMTTGLAVSIARGPIVSFMLVLFCGLFWSKADVGLLPRRQLLFSTVLLVLPIFVLALTWAQSGAQAKVQTKKEELIKMLTFSDPGGTAGQRIIYYKLAAEGFSRKPLLGWGLGSFSMYANGRDERLYPHNLILQFAMEQGVVGLTALGAFALTIFRAARNISFWSGGQWVFFGWVMLYLGCITMFSGNLDDHRAPIFWCGVVAATWRVMKAKLVESDAFELEPQMVPAT